MEIFNIVNSLEKIKSKLRQFCRYYLKKQYIYLLLIVALGMILWWNCSIDKSENIQIKMENDTKKNMQVQGKMLFPVDNQTVVLKNPFSLKHEVFRAKKETEQIKSISVEKAHENVLSKESMEVVQQKASIKYDTYKVKAILQFGGANTVLIEKNKKSYRLELNKWIDDMKLVEVKSQSAVVQLASGALMECQLNKEYKFGA